MKNKIENIKTNFLENFSIAVISLIGGVILSQLFDLKYINYFILVLLFSLSLMYLYYRHSKQVENISDVLSYCYGNCKGDIQYFSDPKVFYSEASKHILSAEYEILTYDDYFGQKQITMGFNTTEEYYKLLENKLQTIISKNKKFNFSRIVGCDNLKDITLSDRYKKHLDFLFKISKNNAEVKIEPFLFRKERIMYLSFTIIDASILRISIEGFLNEKGSLSSKVIGGFIIKNNDEIIEYFRNIYLDMEKLSFHYKSTEEILEQ